MILHLGSGDSPKEEGFVNVDIRPHENVDVVADVRELPFKDGEYEGIACRNLVEHFGRHEIKPLFKEWARVIKKGGTLVIETIDAGHLMDVWRMIPTENLLDGLLGAQTYPENFHKMAFTEENITEYLSEAGFAIIRFKTMVHRHIPRMTVLAEKL